MPRLCCELSDSDTLALPSAQCVENTETYYLSDFSIGHRGACMQFPEHTLRSYEAASLQGAGIVECDVTFTKDLELICRHDQCDLHTTTDVVLRPDMNAKCTTPWAPGVSPSCCASDFTLAEIKSLCAKMDSSGGSGAMTAEEYVYGGTADWRTGTWTSNSKNGAFVLCHVLSHQSLFRLVPIRMSQCPDSQGVH